MRKFDSIKRIDLTDRESANNRDKQQTQSRLQSISRFSNRNFSREHNDMADCLTDRSRNDKVNQFSLGQNSESNGNNGGLNVMTRGNIRTYIRFKPFNRQQIMGEDSDINESGIDIIDQKKVIIDQNFSYSFDRVFGPDSTQKLIYDTTAKELIKNFVNGFNGTIFAYGQTGSGKTYTMFGADDNSTPGIIPQAIEGLFYEIQQQKPTGIKKVELSCSMYQIYKEVICDLMATDKQKDIKIKQNSSGAVQIQNLSVKQIGCKQELMELISRGSDMRRVRGTEVNQRSSRSHLILTLYLNTRVSEFQSRLSKLNLVDLAGSQKVSKTKVSGQGLEQAIKINLSLSCLGNAIYALSKGQEHVPFRDSKLTRVLQQSLSGNSITRVIVTCSMIPTCKQQTISSLKFANRIKTIKTCSSQNIRKTNQQGVNKFMYQTLKASFQSCQQKLQKIKSIVEINCNKMSKQEIVEALKQVFSCEERCSSQNQFLTLDTQPFETFRSPNKYQFTDLQSYHHTEPATTMKEQGKIFQSISEYQQYIKVLQQKITRLQKLQEMQTKTKQIQKIPIQRQQKAEGQQKKAGQKVKILRNNINVSNIGSKLKQIKNRKKQGEQNGERQIVTFRTKYEESGKKTTRTPRDLGTSSLNETKQIFTSCLDRKKSYEEMEKQIMMKQIRALGMEVCRLRKTQSLKQQYPHNSQRMSPQFLYDFNPTPQQILKTQLKNRDNYISQLQQIIETKLNNLSNGLNERSSAEHRPPVHGKTKIQIYTSPISSCQLSRINSAKQLTKF